MADYDVCVVGLGVMGSSTAASLVRRGMRVLGIDRHQPPHAMGSSHGRTRIIREAYFEDPYYVPLVRRSLELWRQLEAETDRPLLRTTGGLMIGPPDGQLLRGAERSAAEYQIACQTLDTRDMAERFPLFRVPEGLQGLFEPRAGVIAAEPAVAAALEVAKQGLFDLRVSESVLRWSTSRHGIAVQTNRSRYTARKLVLTAGAWINDLVNVRPPVTVARQPLFWFAPTQHHALFHQLPIFLYETASHEIYYGFPLDEHGFKVTRHHGGRTASPTTLDRNADPADEAKIRSFLTDAIPDANGPLIEHSVCMYANTPDEDFIIDHLPDDERVVIVSACSGHGFKFAPLIGELAADLTTGLTPQLELARFSFGRIARVL